MLLLLVVTAALSLLPGATSQLAQLFDLTECPVNYYAETYTAAYGFVDEEVFTLVFGNVTGSDLMTFIFENLVELRAFAPTFIVADETSEFVRNLPDLVGTSPCFYGIGLLSSLNTILLHFRTFGAQGAYLITSGVPVTVTTIVRGQLVSTTELTSDTYAYLSGCRYKGQFYPPGTAQCASETVFVTCNATVFLTVSEEDPRCPRKSVCTITVTWSPIDNPSIDDE
ncbi:uncharacterized protein LOC133512739 [Syngnathoides biaculeatus]|uniref:uncharacterized protein LOC133512739 n=1 Tax=Syngnathoides biaculeatus TaxID=300417 RepID=UPI002ADE9101|nr:uncharacterized protein LOC133512739 [Syngnathoides biaculeatus]XP_061698658.1 uncharacterized protein LOC133512739 [Syngnathoides biaculeatus]